MSIIFYHTSCCLCVYHTTYFSFFFFNDTATTEIYTLSLHDALPISMSEREAATTRSRREIDRPGLPVGSAAQAGDRKSTRLNSSHLVISYAVFCLKKKKKIIDTEVNVNRSTKYRACSIVYSLLLRSN